MLKYIDILDRLRVEFYVENKLKSSYKNKYWVIDLLPSLYFVIDRQFYNPGREDSYQAFSIGLSWTFFTIDLELIWKTI